jgi:hypothetical protein
MPKNLDRKKRKIFRFFVTEALRHAVHFEGGMEDLNENLTIKDVAKVLRCSTTHVQNALRGKVPGMPPLNSSGNRQTQNNTSSLAQSVDGKEQSELACRYVRMLCPWRKKENSCVESDFKKEASALANTADARYGLRSGGSKGTNDPRFLVTTQKFPRGKRTQCSPRFFNQ